MPAGCAEDARKCAGLRFTYSIISAVESTDDRQLVIREPRVSPLATMLKSSRVARQAELRLDRLEAATSIADLAGFRGNRLEPMKGDRSGQFSIRINDQWRICFSWPPGSPGPADVEIVDYH